LGKVIDACRVGANLLAICKLGDAFIEEELKGVYTKGKIPKGIAFPTTISPNHVVCHWSPLEEDAEAKTTIAEGDVLKM
jgi:methionine aminopeptidase